VQSCIDNAETFKYKTKRQFWIDVSTDLQRFTERPYSDVSCQRKVENLIARRKAELRVIKTGESQETNPRLYEVLDQWIAIVNTHENDIKKVKNTAKRRLSNIEAAKEHRRYLTTTLGHQLQRTNSQETLEGSPAPLSSPLTQDSSTNDTDEDRRPLKKRKVALDTGLKFLLIQFMGRFGHWESQEVIEDPVLRRLRALEDQQKELNSRLGMLTQIEGKLDILLNKLN